MARPGARLHRQRRRHLQRRQRHPVDRRASIRAAGEIAHLSYDATVTSDEQGALGQLRFKAYRSDPDGGLLGPLDATHFAVGDVAGPTSRLIAGGTGRGAEVTNRPLFNPVAFDRTRFEGDLPAGWDAELYRNGQLRRLRQRRRHAALCVRRCPAAYGDNRFEIILYGPQGQQRSRVETINVGQEPCSARQDLVLGRGQPAGDATCSASSANAARSTATRSATASPCPSCRRRRALEHGLDKRTSVGALAAMMIVGDEKLTFVEGSVRRSVGPALVEAAVARQSGGGIALRGSAIARIGAASLTAEAVSLENFFYQGRFEEQHARRPPVARRAARRPARCRLLGQGDVRFTDRDGRQTTNAAARLSANFNRFNLTSRARMGTAAHRPTARNWPSSTSSRSPRAGSARSACAAAGAGKSRPQARLRSAESRPIGRRRTMPIGKSASAMKRSASRGRARLTHIRRFNALAAAASVEAATDGSVAVGLNLNFSLDSVARGFRPVREPLAGGRPGRGARLPRRQ